MHSYFLIPPWFFFSDIPFHVWWFLFHLYYDSNLTPFLMIQINRSCPGNLSLPRCHCPESLGGRPARGAPGPQECQEYSFMPALAGEAFVLRLKTPSHTEIQTSRPTSQHCYLHQQASQRMAEVWRHPERVWPYLLMSSQSVKALW